MMINRIILGAIFFVSGFLMTSVAAVEEAEYRVLEKEGRFELREYAPRLVAETIVKQEFEDAGDAAFERLFSYISGSNRVSEKIDMTAPVSQTAANDSIRPNAFHKQNASFNDWVISFTMPSKYVLETIPAPTDPAVRIREIPSQSYASVTYSGFWSRENYLENKESLEKWMENRGLRMAGEPVWDRYNPPFTPWFLRRNEVLIPVGTYKRDAER